MEPFRHGELVWSDYPKAIAELAGRPEVRRVGDLGGGAKPRLPLDFIQARELDYEVIDLSAAELAKAPPGYQVRQADVTAPDFARRCGPYELVFSAFLAEHVRRPAAFHANVRAVLRDGGYAVHVFPTLYEPLFAANRLMPEAFAQKLLNLVQPHRTAAGRSPKFPAYYRWCRGPTGRQLNRLESAGFEVVDYVGYFGHPYFKRVGWLHRTEYRLADILTRHPNPWLTSYALVILRAR